MTTTIESVIKQVRDILRVEAITGIDSINHCIFFSIVRYLNESTCQLLGIDPQFSFDKLVQIESDTELFSKIYNPSPNPPSLALYICQKLGYTNIKGNFKVRNTRNLRSIINAFAKVDLHQYTSEYDLIGFIYELHLKSGTSNSMRDLGQYFTPRNVIKYMVELCNPQLGETILDGTCGTGGFLTMAIKHLKMLNSNIDWSKYCNTIYGFDIDDNVHNLARINLFLETGHKCPNICKRNTLNDDLKDSNDQILTGADVLLINEPMGIKGVRFADCCQRIKDLNIGGSKAEPLFLQLFMSALNNGGRCAIVVPDGMLFNENKQYINTRKYLIEHFNLKKVVQIPNGAFLNTGVKTSILYFTNTNTEKTKEVEFCQLELDSEKLVEKQIMIVPVDTIHKNHFSLFVNKYTIDKAEQIEGIKYVKLGDICTFLPTTKHTSSIGQSNGLYRFYNSSQTDKMFVDFKEIDVESIIIGNGGGICIHLDKNFTASKHVTVCQIKTNLANSINIRYLYFCLSHLKENLIKLSAGSTIQWLNKTSISNFEIPIPDIRIQNKIVEQLDLVTENTNQTRQLIETNKTKMKYYLESQLKMHQVQTVKLGDVCSFKCGIKFKMSDDYKTQGTYGYLRIQNLHNTNFPMMYLDDDAYQKCKNCTVKCGDILISDVTHECVCKIVDKDWDNFVFYGSLIKIYNVNPNLDLKYLYYYFINDEFGKQRKNTVHGSAQQHLTLSMLTDITIKMFDISIQQQIVDYFDGLSKLNASLEKQIEKNTQLITNIMNVHLNCAENVEISPSVLNISNIEPSPTTSKISHDEPKSKFKKITKTPTNASPSITCCGINKKSKQPCKNKVVSGKQYCKKHLPTEEEDLVIDDQIVDNDVVDD